MKHTLHGEIKIRMSKLTEITRGTKKLFKRFEVLVIKKRKKALKWWVGPITVRAF